jgi:hypothetical protein
MKKLLFVVAVATISFTTSCTKSCDACTVKNGASVTVGGQTTTNDVELNSKELCELAKKQDASAVTCK